MAEIKYPVITICREYAAGGRSVARYLSEILGIPWYDKDFVKETVKASGFSEEDILANGEELSTLDKVVDSVLNSVVSYTSIHDAVYRAQVEEVLKLASSGAPCIIVGRCANMILQNEGIASFDVFLYADLEHRISRAKELGIEGDVEKYVANRDKLRDNYYKNYTKKDHGNYRDYDLMLNTGLLGYEKCAKLIADSVVE